MHQRLFEITHILLRQGGATAGELAARFGVSTRTIYRDIDALSGAGVPVYAEKGRGGGIRLLPDYVLDKTLFSKDEQAQLVAHFESLASLGTPDTAPVLEKLAALFGRSDSWLEVDYAPWGGGEASRALFRLLRDAILRHRVVRFAYAGMRTAGTPAEGETREVEPARIVFRGQGWYLLAYCRMRGAFRYFKLSRMRGTALTGEGFAPGRVPPVPEAPSARPHLRAVLRFAPGSAFRVLDEFAEEQVEALPDGGFLVRCSFLDDDWVVGYLLSFGPAAEVLEPPRLREKVAESLRAMAALYDG